MDFNRMKVLITSIVIVSCSAGAEKSKKPDERNIGVTLESIAPLYSPGGLESNITWIADESSRQIHKVSVHPLEIIASFTLDQPQAQHTLIGKHDGQYVIDFFEKNIQIIRADGSRTTLPIKFRGTPKSAAYSSDQGILVMLDDLGTVGVMMLDANGDVLKSWVGGSLIAEDKSIVAGDLGIDGKLVIAMDDDSMAVIDIEKSIDEETWFYETFVSEIHGISWLAPDNDDPNNWLVIGADGIGTLNLKERTFGTKQVKFKQPVLSSEVLGLPGVSRMISDLPDPKLDYPTYVGPSNSLATEGEAQADNLIPMFEVVTKSKLGKPHIAMANIYDSTERIYYFNRDGQIASHAILTELTLSSATGSYFSKDAEELRVLVATSDFTKVYGMRISDNLVTVAATLPGGGTPVLGESFLFVDRKSALGLFESLNLENEERQKLEGFNFSYFRAARGFKGDRQ